MKSAPRRRFDLMLTAQEAFPAFEREFLKAQHEIIAGFRVFDPWTTLQSDAARKVGDTWFDLIVDTLKRDVRITVFISDFDPVVRLEHHKDTWAALRALCAAGQASHNPGLLQATAVMHPARVGLLPRLLLWPRLIKELRDGLSGIAEGSRSDADAFLQKAPGMRSLTKWKGDTLVPRLFPPPPLVPVSHHQKLAVFDEQRLYIGGLDLNDRRYDTREHDQEPSQTWHDVQVMVDGPIAKEAADHLRRFQTVAEGGRPPRTRHLLRTLSTKRKFAFPFLSPRPVVTELADAHRTQIAAATTLIYLETQYFRNRDLARQLAHRAWQKPSLSLILILPSAPEEAAFYDEPGSDVAFGEHLQAECVDIVRTAFGPRVFFGAPAQPRAAQSDGRTTFHGAPLVYVHAKVSIFDDRCGIVSSANLNGRSFAWDTEAGVATQDEDEVAQLKYRCFDHWLGPDADPACHDDKTACDAWAAQAARNVQRAPQNRCGFILPYSVGPAAEAGYNLPGVPDEMV